MILCFQARTDNFGADYNLLASFVKLYIRDKGAVNLESFLFNLLLRSNELCAVVFLVIAQGAFRS